MKFIAHRKNTLEDLRVSPTEFGIEIDIRSYDNKLILQHEPFMAGELFEDWLKEYCHGTLILNVKEEGLESHIIELMKIHKIKEYFFLDQSFPFLVKWSSLGESRCAIRVSEFETVETALSLAGKVDWVWIDSFTHFSLTHDEASRLKQAGYKLCIVSPELQGRDAEKEIPELHKLLMDLGIFADAVCTKHPALWKSLHTL
jgi:hypothetical protein